MSTRDSDSCFQSTCNPLCVLGKEHPGSQIHALSAPHKAVIRENTARLHLLMKSEYIIMKPSAKEEHRFSNNNDFRLL